MNEITTNELAQKLNNNEDLSIIDVREDEEVAQGMIPGAKHIPLAQIPERFYELDKDQQYVIVCRSGRRSQLACTFLMEQGFNAINMTGGMLDWNDTVE